MVTVAVLSQIHGASAASDKALEKQITDQQQQITAQQAEIDALKQQLKDVLSIVNTRVSKAEVQAETATKPVAHAAQSSSNKLSLETADGKFSIAPTGIVQIDTGGYLGFKPDNRFVGTQRLAGGVNARRARVGVSGKMFGDWTYKFLYDGGNSQDTTASCIEAAQISYTGW
jgi:phosphate-selective porin OprO/OprP